MYVHTESFLQKLEQGWNAYQQQCLQETVSYLLWISMISDFPHQPTCTAFYNRIIHLTSWMLADP
jgi:hypothetical protein